MSCTLVSAFYPIKSKFPKTQYLEWGKTFMKLDTPLVFFTEPTLISELNELRGNRPIRFIGIPFEELDAWKLYKDKWIQNYSVDPEMSYHTPELYAIWAQKSFFVEKAALINFFNTQYFFWCDFGAFRNPDINTIILQSFPRTKYFRDDKVLLEGIGDLEESDKVIDEDGLPLPHTWNKVRIVGGLWGGSIKGCLKWKELYQNMLEKYFEKGRFAGKDQTVMLSAYMKNPESAIIVKHSESHIDSWFFFEYLLSDLNIPLVINNTYNIQMNTNLNIETYKDKIDNRPIVYITLMGGLGNQLFQIATAYSYAKQYNAKLKILSRKVENDGRPLYWDSILSSCSKFLIDIQPENLIEWNEESPLSYKDIPEPTKNGIYIKGYLQTPKYFLEKNTIKELKYLFSPSESIMDIINTKYKHLLKNKERVVVIHARRTDYLKNQDIINFHGPLTKDYYYKAIKTISSNIDNPIYLLASDDPDFWLPLIIENQYLRNNNNYILYNENDVNTLALLQQFNYFIIANSTFSWWAAWLSKNPKMVIAPSKWFGPTGPQNYQDIYMPQWILI